jgi:hypothetical protein
MSLLQQIMVYIEKPIEKARQDRKIGIHSIDAAGVLGTRCRSG